MTVAIQGLFLGILMLAGLFFASPSQALSHGATGDPGAIDGNDTVTLKGNVNPLARPEFDKGRTDPSLQMSRMILALRLGAGKRAELERLLSELQDPASPHYHRWLTPGEFGLRFGPSTDEISIVTGWLKSQGFVVEEVAKGRLWINFSGSVALVERAFHTQIHNYFIGGHMYHANSLDPSILRALSGMVAGVVTLHDFPRRMMHNGILPVKPDFTSGSGHYISPGDFSIIYNVNALYGAGITGAAQSIAIVGRTHPSTASSDWATFRSMMGLPANPPRIIINGQDPGDLGFNEDAEADLDVEWSGAVAKNASIIFVASASTASTDGVDLSAQYIVNNNLAPVMSTSFGSCEQYMGASENKFYNDLWQQAAAQGITPFVSSGDAGAAGCNSGGDTTGTILAVNGLASTPYDVAVGGSEFDEGSGDYWDTSNGTTYTSALSYIPEVAWNESGAVTSGSDLWATGGGASVKYGKPAWQVSPGVPAGNSRYVPDVSLSAAKHDAYLAEIQGGLYAVSGTSASSPSFASIMAFIAQKTDQRQGNANPRFYQLGSAQFGAAGAPVFHNIVMGDNTVPGVTGYSAAAGYAPVSGLGSVDVNALVHNWVPDFTISISPAVLSVAQGATGACAISTAVSGDFSNAVSLSASGLPAGVTATFSPAVINAPGSGSSTLAIAARTSSPAGSVPVTITGTGGGIIHAATLDLTILQVFNITSSVTNGTGGAITPANATVVSGGSITLGITPCAGYDLAYLTDNGANVTGMVNNGGYTIPNVTGAHTVVATFAIYTFSVNASVSGDGSIVPASSTVNYGARVTFTITPAAGYTLASLTDNGSDVTADAVWNASQGAYTYTLSNITSDHTVQAGFVAGAPLPTTALSAPAGFLLVAGLGLLLWRSRKKRQKR